MSVNPNLTATEVKQRIIASADKIDMQNPVHIGKIGAGRINAQKALSAQPQPALQLIDIEVDYNGNSMANIGDTDVPFRLSFFNKWTEYSFVTTTISSTDPRITLNAPSRLTLFRTDHVSTTPSIWTMTIGSDVTPGIYELVLHLDNGVYSENISIPLIVKPEDELNGITYQGVTNISPLVTNFNYDEHNEVVCALNMEDGSSELVVHENGEERNYVINTSRWININSRPAAGELSPFSDDPWDEIVIPGLEGDLYIVTTDGTRDKEIKLYNLAEINDPYYVSIGNVDTDEENEIILITTEADLYIYDWDIVNGPDLLFSHNFSGNTENSVTIGDINSDNIEDMYITLSNLNNYYSGLRRVHFDENLSDFTISTILLSKSVRNFQGAPIIGRFGNSDYNELFVPYFWFNNRIGYERVYDLIDHNNLVIESYHDDFYFSDLGQRQFSSAFQVDYSTGTPSVISTVQNSIIEFNNDLSNFEVYNQFYSTNTPVKGITSSMVNGNQKIYTISNGYEITILDEEMNDIPEYHIHNNGEVLGIPVIIDMDNDNIAEFVSFSKINNRLVINSFKTNFTMEDSNTDWGQYSGNMHNSHCYSNVIKKTIEDGDIWNKDVTIVGQVDAELFANLKIRPGVKVKFEENAKLVFEKSGVTAKGNINEKVKFVGNFENSTMKHYGVEFKNADTTELNNCEISDAETAIKISNTYRNYNINGLELYDNDNGIDVYNSNPNLVNLNVHDNSNVGFTSHHNSNSILKNSTFKDNGGIEVSIDNSYPALSQGLNDIWPDQGYSLRYNDTTLPVQTLYARELWWGLTDEPYIQNNLISGNVLIAPISLVPFNNTSTRNSYDNILYLYEDAVSCVQEAPEQAEIYLKEIIEENPESDTAKLALSGLITCYEYANGNYEVLQSYYIGLLESENCTYFGDKFLNSLITYCKRKNLQYSSAINDYEQILQTEPCFQDSCYAIIDLGDTYIESGFSSRGKMSQFVPRSVEDHEKLKEKLLAEIRDRATDNNNESNAPNLILELHNNYPNPFNPTTNISFELPEKAKVELSVFNIKGQKVKTLTNDILPAGNHNIVWNGTDDMKSQVASGVYFYKLQTKNKSISKKMLLLK